MIAYVKCSCKTEDKLFVSRLKQQGYEIRQTDRNPAFRKQAKEYGAKLPFTVVQGVVTEL